jgi:hypothetical protein
MFRAIFTTIGGILGTIVILLAIAGGIYELAIDPMKTTIEHLRGEKGDLKEKIHRLEKEKQLCVVRVTELSDRIDKGCASCSGGVPQKQCEYLERAIRNLKQKNESLRQALDKCAHDCRPAPPSGWPRRIQFGNTERERIGTPGASHQYYFTVSSVVSVNIKIVGGGLRNGLMPHFKLLGPEYDVIQESGNGFRGVEERKEDQLPAGKYSLIVDGSGNTTGYYNLTVQCFGVGCAGNRN